MKVYFETVEQFFIYNQNMNKDIYRRQTAYNTNAA